VRSLPANKFSVVSQSTCSALYFYRLGDAYDTPRDALTTVTELEVIDFTKKSWVCSMKFVNNFEYPIEIYWEDEAQVAIFQDRIEPTSRLHMTSKIGHVFYATKVGDSFAIVDFMEVTGELEYVFRSSNRLENCEVRYHKDISFTGGLSRCDDMELRYIEFAHNNFHEKRLGLNFYQPQIVRAVTKEGFLHMQLPTDTFTWLKAWYEEKQVEENLIESSSGSCMNQAVSPSTVTHITSVEKSRLAGELQPILEGWYGGELFMTSIYGVRKYSNGSVLRMHVDTMDTHVVSCSK
jgi:hypothetical protein